MRLLITGAFGYVGARVALALERAGHDCVLAGRRVPSWAMGVFPGREMLAVDMLDEEAVRAAVHGIGAVVHLAALNERESIVDPSRATTVREEGTRILMRAVASSPVRRVIFSSTFHVYRPGRAPVVDESTPIGPLAAYGTAHVAGERACVEGARRDGMVVILRISNVYGSPAHVDVDRWTLAHNDLCRQAVREGRIRIHAPGVHRDLVWVNDVAQAMDVALRADPRALANPIFNVGGDRVVTIGEVAQVVRSRAERLLQTEVSLEVTSDQTDPAFTYSSARLAALGYRPRDALVAETDALLMMLREAASAR